MNHPPQTTADAASIPVPRWRQRVFRLYQRSSLRHAFRAAGCAAIAVLSFVLIFNLSAERRWQAYRLEAQKRTTVVFPGSLPDPIPAELNLAASGPFAAYLASSTTPPPAVAELEVVSWVFHFYPDVASGWRPPMGRTLAALSLIEFDQRIGPVWARVLEAEAKPLTQYRIDRSWPNGNQLRISFLAYRKAAQNHANRAIAFIELSQGNEALTELRGIRRLATAVGSEPDLVSQMIGVAVTGLQLNAIWWGLDRRIWNDAQLSELDAMLASIEFGPGFVGAIRSERQWFNSMMDHTCEMPPWERIDLIRKIPGIFTLSGGKEPMAAMVSDGFVRENQVKVNQWLDETETVVGADGVWRPYRLADHKLEGFSRARYSLALMCAPTYQRAAARAGLIAARARQARIAIALERLRLRDGTRPERLHSLVPDFLDRIPADPFDGQPMRYQSWPNGAFSLWSVGPLGIDEQGAPGTDDPGDPLDIVWHGLVHESAE